MAESSEPKPPSLMEEVQSDLDAVVAAGEKSERELACNPPTFKRLKPSAPTSPPPSVQSVAPVVSAPSEPPLLGRTNPAPVMVTTSEKPFPRQYDTDIEAEAKMPYRAWIREKSEKYDRLMRCRTVPDFIDLDALNTVMAEFPATFIEVSREARLWADRVEDEEAAFASWWSQRLVEARTAAHGEGAKITSDSGLSVYAQAKFATEYGARQDVLREVKHRAEFLGTLKLVVQNSATVFKALAPSLSFEWSISGGLTVRGDPSGITFRGSPARRIEDKPAPDALLRARRARQEGTA